MQLALSYNNVCPHKLIDIFDGEPQALQLRYNRDIYGFYPNFSRNMYKYFSIGLTGPMCSNNDLMEHVERQASVISVRSLSTRSQCTYYLENSPLKWSVYELSTLTEEQKKHIKSLDIVIICVDTTWIPEQQLELLSDAGVRIEPITDHDGRETNNDSDSESIQTVATTSTASSSFSILQSQNSADNGQSESDTTTTSNIPLPQRVKKDLVGQQLSQPERSKILTVKFSPSIEDEEAEGRNDLLSVQQHLNTHSIKIETERDFFSLEQDVLPFHCLICDQFKYIQKAVKTLDNKEDYDIPWFGKTVQFWSDLLKYDNSQYFEPVMYDPPIDSDQSTILSSQSQKTLLPFWVIARNLRQKTGKVDMLGVKTSTGEVRVPHWNDSLSNADIVIIGKKEMGMEDYFLIVYDGAPIEVIWKVWLNELSMR